MIVGVAEVMVVANTAAFRKELESSTAPAFAGLADDAEVAGADAGAGLRKGVRDGTKDLESDLSNVGAAAGGGLRRGVTEQTGRMADDVAKDGERAGEDLHKGMSSGLSKLATLISNTGLPLGGLSSGLEKTGGALEHADSKSSGLAGSLDRLGGVALMGVAAAGAVVAGVGIHMAEGMQTADASIASAAGTSTKAAAQIGNAFLDTAGKTEFGGEEMAKAYAGVAGQLKSTEGHALGTSEALSVMNASADLAEATGGQLAGTTSTVASALQAFQLKASDAAHVTDVLYSASNATGQGVDSLGTSLAKVRSKLGDTAGSVGDLAGLLVDMTDQGITGRAAMSGLNSGMNTLQKSATGVQTAVSAQKAAYDQMPPSLQKLADSYRSGAMSSSDFTKATDALPPAQAALAKSFATASTAALTAQLKFKEMGVTAFDASGKFVGMGQIIDQLHPKFAQMTQQQQLAAAATLFGAGAARQMTAIINAGPAAYDKATSSVNKMGAAHQAAAKQSATLHGEERTLEAEMGDLATKVGAVLIPIITSMVGWFVKATSFVADHKAALIALAAVVTGILGPAIAVFTINKMASFGQSFVTAGGHVKTFASGVQTAVQKVIGLFTQQSAAAEESATKIGTSTKAASASVATEATEVGASTDAVDASFAGTATAADAAATDVGVAETATAGEVTAADSAIEAENAAAGGSFAAITAGATSALGALTPLLGALGVTAGGVIAGNAIAGATGASPGQQQGVETPGSTVGGVHIPGTPSGGTLPLVGHVGGPLGSVLGFLEGNIDSMHRSTTATASHKGATDKNTASTDKLTAVLAQHFGGAGAEGSPGGSVSVKAGKSSGTMRSAEDSFAPAAVTRWAAIAEAASAKYGIPASVLLADIDQESTGNPNDVSSTGAFGTTQFEPSTAAKYGVKRGSSTADVTSQIMGQAAYLKALGYANDPTAALEGYETGRVGDPVGAGYAAQVLGGQHLYSQYDRSVRAPSVPAYVDPLGRARGVVQGRTDQGVDYTATPGSPIDALGAGRIIDIVKNWYKGQPLVEEQLTQGPKAGQDVYYAEQLTPGVKQGQAVARGQQIGTVAASGTGLELGFGAPGGRTRAMATTGYTEGEVTVAGRQYAAFMASIKAGTAGSIAASGLSAAQTAQLTAAQTKATYDKNLGTIGGAETSQLSTAAHSGTLAELKKDLDAIHTKGIDGLSKLLVGAHTKTLTELEQKLVAAHQAALAKEATLEAQAAKAAQQKSQQAALTAQVNSLDRQTTLIGDKAKAQADKIADSTKVYLDKQAAVGLTGTALVAANAQTSLDQVTQSNDQAIDAAQTKVDQAVGGSKLSQAQAANELAKANATATIQQATAQSVLDKANALASAASSTSTTASSTTTNAPEINLNIYGTGNMTTGQLFSEIGFAVRSGALPIAPPPVAAVA